MMDGVRILRAGGLALLVAVLIAGGCASTTDESSLLVSPRISLEDPVDAPAPPPSADAPTIRSADGLDSSITMTSYQLRIGDPVVVALRGIYPQDQQNEDIIDEFGNITMPLIGDIRAQGRTPSQLESLIHDAYIDGGYYRDLTVNVVMPTRSYFVQGEVRAPGRYGISRGMTLMQAITAAGGYSDFANTRSVKVIRNGVTTTYNMRRIERNPSEDVPVESGDVIVIDRSIF